MDASNLTSAHILEALVRESIGVVLIVAADGEFVDDESWLYELVDGLFVRSNEGFDFAAWGPCAPPSSGASTVRKRSIC